MDIKILPEFFGHNIIILSDIYLALPSSFQIHYTCLSGHFIIISTGVPCITDCVMGELEKLGSKFRVAQQIAKDPRFERLPCMHKGTYADDCLVNRVTQVSRIISVSHNLKERERERGGMGWGGTMIMFSFPLSSKFSFNTASLLHCGNM